MRRVDVHQTKGSGSSASSEIRARLFIARVRDAWAFPVSGQGFWSREADGRHCYTRQPPGGSQAWNATSSLGAGHVMRYVLTVDATRDGMRIP
jgi:hypothetical protein